MLSLKSDETTLPNVLKETNRHKKHLYCCCMYDSLPTFSFNYCVWKCFNGNIMFPATLLMSVKILF